MTNLYLKVYSNEHEEMLIDGTEEYTICANIDDILDDIKKIISKKKVIIHSDENDDEPDEFTCISDEEIPDVLDLIYKKSTSLIKESAKKIDSIDKNEGYELLYKMKNLNDALFLIKTKNDKLLLNKRAILQIGG
ncbi:hypothetical protein O0Q62_003632 [Proteus mirabilis]|nr:MULTISPECIES: hypothetical protein [Morganellaceae]EKU8091315.1 hypothetical protein [Proteus mirabilis]EKV7963303.1 hypothetical protein [Proteus mirabilis]ELB1172014.1 hypothetical protein [Proteus mirabilis]ELB4604129.1 hypothetical protein [Proteus mirabilis]EMF1950272.1 hypothetical protein [Proteus mirabilis]